MAPGDELSMSGVVQMLRGEAHGHSTIILCLYRGADKSLARPGRKQTTATVVRRQVQSVLNVSTCIGISSGCHHAPPTPFFFNFLK